MVKSRGIPAGRGRLVPEENKPFGVWAPPMPAPVLLAEDEGFEAFITGASIHHNPYILGTVKHAAWREGWQSAARYCGKSR